ncbi:MAG: hypothetical protein IKE31_08465 [Eubacterium sp.]|nr:hypothetical protein [Eubacterium sp.]
MSTWKSILIALLIGAAIGLVAGVITAPERKQQKESKLEQTHEEPEAESSSAEKPESSSADKDTGIPTPDTEEYKEYLEKVAEEKNITIEGLGELGVADEAYHYLLNTSYPRNDYDKNAFEESETGQRSYTDTKKYTSRCGIDVSEFNGEIDWNQVKQAGYEFVFIRLGYRGYESGELYMDALFEKNLQGAQEAGLDVGVYFFSQAATEDEAREEAAYVLHQLDGIDLQLPVMYDPEAISFDTARTDKVTGSQFSKNALVFCKEIEKGGYEAGYYANLKWLVFMLDMKALEEYDVWFAGYDAQPQSPYAFTFWQYSDTGEVPGVPENTDLDIQLIPTS